MGSNASSTACQLRALEKVTLLRLPTSSSSSGKCHLSGVRGVLDQISETMYVRDIILSLAQRRHNNRFVG